MKLRDTPAGRRAHGLATGRAFGGRAFDETIRFLAEVDPELADCLVSYVFGTVMVRPVLSPLQKELVIIAGLTALGQQAQLHWHVSAALHLGTPSATVRETIVHCIPFCGWPAGLNALATFQAALGQHEGGKASDVVGATAAVHEWTCDELRARGRGNGARLYEDYGALEGFLRTIDPELPLYLTEQVFGQFYARTGLDLRTRQLAAVSLLTALQRLPQLASHIEGAHRVGCAIDETKEAIVLMHIYAGWPAMLNALQTWRDVIGRAAKTGEGRG